MRVFREQQQREEGKQDRVCCAPTARPGGPTAPYRLCVVLADTLSPALTRHRVREQKVPLRGPAWPLRKVSHYLSESAGWSASIAGLSPRVSCLLRSWAQGI